MSSEFIIIKRKDSSLSVVTTNKEELLLPLNEVKNIKRSKSIEKSIKNFKDDNLIPKFLSKSLQNSNIFNFNLFNDRNSLFLKKQKNYKQKDENLNENNFEKIKRFSILKRTSQETSSTTNSKIDNEIFNNNINKSKFIMPLNYINENDEINCLDDYYENNFLYESINLGNENENYINNENNNNFIVVNEKENKNNNINNINNNNYLNNNININNNIINNINIKNNINNININNNINNININSKNINNININNDNINQIIKTENEDENLNTPENKLLLSNLIFLSKEQTSCRYIQQKINENPKLASEYFYPTIISNINILIINQFGNYLIQNILPHLNENQINEIISSISNNFLFICTNFYGTRVIQKLIDFINNEFTMWNLLNNFKMNFPKFVNDINSSHIIFKLLNLKKTYITKFLYELINQNLIEISKHKHGCCSIQKILESDSIYTENIIKNIINNSLDLIIDKYGNYTIQYILQLKGNHLNKFKLMMKIIPNFNSFAMQKYSSTVLEKCFELCDENVKTLMYQYIINQSVLKQLLCDKYGNYVIQKAIEKANNKTIKLYLLQLIAPIINEIKKENFGRQLYRKLMIKYPEFQQFINELK